MSKDRIVKKLGIVVQPDELQIIQRDAPIGETQSQHADDRTGAEYDQANQPGQDEQIKDAFFALGAR